MDSTTQQMPTTPPTNPPSTMSALKKKRMLWLVSAAVVLLAIIVIAVTLSLNQGSSDNGAAGNVSITSKGVEPASVKLKQGQSLTITNKDSRAHDLTADQTMLSGFATPQALRQGDTYSYTFEKTGTYHFYDPSDPSAYNGTVIVE